MRCWEGEATGCLLVLPSMQVRSRRGSSQSIAAAALCPSHLQNYSSSSTVELLSKMAADAAAFSAEVADEPAAASRQPHATPDATTDEAGAAGAAAVPAAACAADPMGSCEGLEGLPFNEWEQRAASERSELANATWAWPDHSPTLPAVDYPAAAEALCACLSEASSAAVPEAAPPNGGSDGFVRRQGNLLLADGSPLFFVGFNAPSLAQWAFRGWPGDLAAVDALMSNASRQVGLVVSACGL